MMTAAEARLFTVTFGEGWREVTEMGFPLIVIPELRAPRGEVVQAVFVRSTMNGYPTRLFFDKPLTPTQGLAVHTHPFQGKVMYAHSINAIGSELPPHEAVLAHLQMYR